MIYVDGMNRVADHIETLKWLYSLLASRFRLVVKTTLKLLVVFVEFSDVNCAKLLEAIQAIDEAQGHKLFSNVMKVLDEQDGIDSELLVFAMTLINKTMYGIPDQDTFYDVADALEMQNIDKIQERYRSKKGLDKKAELLEQFNQYDLALQNEDEEETKKDVSVMLRERRKSDAGTATTGASSSSSTVASCYCKFEFVAELLPVGLCPRRLPVFTPQRHSPALSSCP